MLLDLIVALFVGIAQALLSAVPEVNFNPTFLAGFDKVGYLFEMMSYFVPMDIFFACLSVFFLLHNITLIISIFNWVIRKIPTIS